MLLFLIPFFIKTFYYIFILMGLVTISCTGSKKYFKAAEKLEKQGLVNEAAQYYYESLERKKSNTDARIKLKEVGQKHVNNLASSFFREFNTQQYEQSIETFDEMTQFSSKSKILKEIETNKIAKKEIRQLRQLRQLNLKIGTGPEKAIDCDAQNLCI